MNRDDLRLFEQAAKSKDKSRLKAMIYNYEASVYNTIRKEFNMIYKDEIDCSVQNFLIALSYTLHYNEDINLKNDELCSFMEDLFVTVDYFRTGEYKPEDYLQQLEDDGIKFQEYDYDKLYREKDGIYQRRNEAAIDFINDKDTYFEDGENYQNVKFIESILSGEIEIGERHKIITLCGSTKYKDLFLQKAQDLTLEGWIVIQPGVFAHTDNIKITDEQKIELDKIHKQKIDISDAIFVINKDGYIGDSTKSEIEYAITHNKQIFYLEEVKDEKTK